MLVSLILTGWSLLQKTDFSLTTIIFSTQVITFKGKHVQHNSYCCILTNDPVEEYQDIIALTEDRLNECKIVTPTKRRWALNYYITQCTGNSISWRQDVVEKTRTQQREPSGPWLISWGSDELEIRCGKEN